MQFQPNSRRARRCTLLGCSAMLATAVASHAFGQAAPGSGATLDEIVVTAQKREQSLQDVPIAVTAVNQDMLQTNRIITVQDLTSIAPNLTVVTTAGNAGIPTFGMRGVVSAGSVAGQDRSVGLYLDGVSIGSPLGSVFDLPDLERIEVLRGPQGTLFGRNSTAGAVSVITRNPSGEFGLQQAFTFGNYDQFRSSTRIETPAWGPLSASVSYTHDEREGDMKNLGAGQVWDRTAQGLGRTVSPRTLGDKNNESVFVAVKFEPNDTFSTVYKYDWMESDFTGEGTGLIAFTPEQALPPTFAPLVRAIFNANPPPFAGPERPKYVNNAFVTPGHQKVSGHNLTTNIRISDNLSVKNILAYRTSSIVTGGAELTGAGGLKNIFSFLGPVGDPWVLYVSQPGGTANQWSEELQVNYDSKFLTLTAGGIYFDLDTTEGALGNTGRVILFSTIPGGVIPTAGRDYNVNSAKSWAGYMQAEVHVTPQLDLIGGYRLTTDKKEGINFVGGRPLPFTYEKTRPSYLAGVNYKPADDILVYAKYSTGFVAGGTVSTITFDPETVKSWEGGAKAELLDRRLRLNLAAFSAKYKHLQSVSAGTFIGRPELGTVVIDQGDLKTKGFEVEATAAPMRGLTFNSSLGYTDYKLSNLNPIYLAIGAIHLQYRAKWTANLSAQYESEPVFGEARVVGRVDGNWRSKIRLIGQAPIPLGQDEVVFSPAGWVINARLALRDIQLKRGNLEVALWGKNLTDQDRVMFPINFTFANGSSYERARTFGLDVIYNY